MPSTAAVVRFVVLNQSQSQRREWLKIGSV